MATAKSLLTMGRTAANCGANRLLGEFEVWLRQTVISLSAPTPETSTLSAGDPDSGRPGEPWVEIGINDSACRHRRPPPFPSADRRVIGADQGPGEVSLTHWRGPACQLGYGTVTQCGVHQARCPWATQELPGKDGELPSCAIFQ